MDKVINAVAIFAGARFLALFMGLAIVMGIPLYIIGEIPGFSQLFVAIGIKEDVSLLTARPLRINWNGEGTGKVMTVSVTNNSGEAWDRFEIICQTDDGQYRAYDSSGILPGETNSVRSYGIDSSTASTVSGTCRLLSHMRGKPKAWDEYNAFHLGDGGWGDRLPSEQAASVTGNDPDLDPTIDYD